MRLYKLTKNSYDYYRQNVKGNEFTTYNQARKKLTRNILLSSNKMLCGDGDTIFFYGNLEIRVNKANKIILLKNNHSINYIFRVDRDKYNELNELLGITDNKPGLIEKLVSKLQVALVA